MHNWINIPSQGFVGKTVFFLNVCFPSSGWQCLKGVDAGVNLSNPCRFYRCVDFVIVKLGIKLKGHFQVPKNNPFHRDPLIFQLHLGTICVKNQPIQNLGTTYFQNRVFVPNFIINGFIFFRFTLCRIFRPVWAKSFKAPRVTSPLVPLAGIFFGEEKKGPKKKHEKHKSSSTPWKINMEPENDGLEDDFPFQLGDF